MQWQIAKRSKFTKLPIVGRQSLSSRCWVREAPVPPTVVLHDRIHPHPFGMTIAEGEIGAVKVAVVRDAPSPAATGRVRSAAVATRR
jgi:hypothetical protein